MPIYTRKPGMEWEKLNLGPIKLLGFDEKKIMGLLTRGYRDLKPGDKVVITAVVLDNSDIIGRQFINDELTLEFLIRR